MIMCFFYTNIFLDSLQKPEGFPCCDCFMYCVGMRRNRYLWGGLRFLTRQTYGCIYGLLSACAEAPTEGGRTSSILCFDLNIPASIIINLRSHNDNCNKVNFTKVLRGNQRHPSPPLNIISSISGNFYIS